MMNGFDAAAVEMSAMLAAWRALAIDWALNWGERRSLLPAGEDDGTWVPADSETRMRILIEIGRHIPFDHYDGLRDWLREPVKELSWNSPLEAMSSSLPDLRRFRCYVERGCYL